ncbi:MAG: Arc family DNA-binding protein [Alphaproteobacteria bacterium]|nr:Arc family DNA-binding protein [Alphaproteobacteria bacterium]MDE2112912.1 Arc family DNA-binding protein [Alphaproteobacteria bacterium]MDE2493781.1 Arc family DNA-binding protein [Alphaproteobacteria bacterium]
MAVLTVRNIPEEVHRALRMRAASHGHSTEAEIRAILAEAVKPPVRVGDALARIGRKAGLTDQELDALARDKTPAEPVRFK